MLVLVLVWVVVCALPASVPAELASEPALPAAGGLDAGGLHSCALLAGGGVRCWGYGANGQLGYANTDSVGDDETPASVGPVNLGAGRTAKAIAAGDFHTCAILDDGSVRCWGFGGDGRLGYGNTNDVSDPGSVGPVHLGGHSARAITAGEAHTCAILDDGSVRCWGFGGGGFPAGDGRLGYGTTSNVGDKPTTTPDIVGPVKLGLMRTAVAISAGGTHTCAILDDHNVRCWGLGADGQLGYGKTSTVGDTLATTPDTAGPVNLGAHTAVAISAGEGGSVGGGFIPRRGEHTCALLDDHSVSCWGYGARGELGYGSTSNVGDTPTTTPDMAGPVNLGAHTAVAVSAGDDYSCAILDDRSVRCWGLAAEGRLGYPTLDSLGNQDNVGDNETPGSLGPVDLGPARTATAISSGGHHTCARLDDASVRCWGYGAYGQIGYCSTDTIGDDETPGSAGPVNLQPGDGGAACASTTATPAGGAGPSAAVGGGPGAPPGAGGHPVDALASEAVRAQDLRRCLAAAAHLVKRRKNRARTDCLKRYGRTPGRVGAPSARASTSTQALLSFAASGSDGQKPPAAHAYLVKQSRHPIRSARDFRRAQGLCNGYCRFTVTTPGTRISLTITRLRPHSVYYYAIAARDNVSGTLGPRSPAARVRTR